MTHKEAIDKARDEIENLIAKALNRAAELDADPETGVIYTHNATLLRIALMVVDKYRALAEE